MTRTVPSLVVIGATGYTGRLVARQARDSRRPFVVAARKPDKLEELAAELGKLATPRVVDVTDRESLASLLIDGDVVINCAGPFVRLGTPVVEACVNAGAHYLDTTGEQVFMHDVYTQFHDPARERGITLVPGMAFEYALGDLAAALAAQELTRPLRSVDVIYAWQGSVSSRGTRRTAVRIIGRRGWILDQGELRLRAQGAARRTVRISSGEPFQAVLFTSGEVLTLPRHLSVDSVHGWAVVGRAIATLAPLIAPILPFTATLLRPVLRAIATRRPDPEPAQREASRFTIRVEAQDQTGIRRAVELRGRDPYALTAAVAVMGARRTLEPGVPRGAIAPAQLVEPRSFLTALAPMGLRLVENV